MIKMKEKNLGEKKKRGMPMQIHINFSLRAQ